MPESIANLTAERLVDLANYWVAIVLLGIGLYSIITQTNFIKKIIGLAMFQGGVFILYVSLGKVDGGTAPILKEGLTTVQYSNPLPHVLILTAIVVGIATIAVALSLIVRIREAYGSIEEDDILEADREDDALGQDWRADYGESDA